MERRCSAAGAQLQGEPRDGQRDWCLGKGLSQLLPQEQAPLSPSPSTDRVQHPKDAYSQPGASKAAHQADAGNNPQLCTRAKNSQPTLLSRAESQPSLALNFTPAFLQTPVCTSPNSTTKGLSLPGKVLPVSRIRAGEVGEEAGGTLRLLKNRPNVFIRTTHKGIGCRLNAVGLKCFPRLLGAGGLIRES